MIDVFKDDRAVELIEEFIPKMTWFEPLIEQPRLSIGRQQHSDSMGYRLESGVSEVVIAPLSGVVSKVLTVPANSKDAVRPDAHYEVYIVSTKDGVELTNIVSGLVTPPPIEGTSLQAGDILGHTIGLGPSQDAIEWGLFVDLRPVGENLADYVLPTFVADRTGLLLRKDAREPDFKGSSKVSEPKTKKSNLAPLGFALLGFVLLKKGRF